MAAVSIERIRNWLSKNRTVDDYAFSPLEIALGTGAPPGEVAMLCESAAGAGMLASVYAGGAQFFTHPAVGFEDKISSRSMKALIDGKKVWRVSDHYEWGAAAKAVS